MATKRKAGKKAITAKTARAASSPGLKVSVVVPTYNEEALVERTLENLRAVTPRGTEIIVADGYSKDKTTKIAARYAKVVFEDAHSVGGGRNAGAEKVKGDVVWFVDADTFPTREFYDSMVAEFENDPEVVGVGCHIMPENITAFRRLVFYGLNMVVFSTVMLGRPNIAGSCVAYRKRQFDAIGGFDTETHSAEDMDLTQRISKLGRVVFLFHAIVPTSDRRVHKLGLLGLFKDWTHATLMFIAGRKTKEYYAPR